MKKWLTLAVATLVLGCTEEVTQWTPELDLDAPNAQLAEAPDLSDELAALQAQIAALEAALKEAGDSDASLKEELAKLKDELAKLSGEDDKKIPKIDLSQFKLLSNSIVTGYGVWIKAKEASTALEIPVGTPVLNQSSKITPTENFSNFTLASTCLTICPNGTAPYARSVETKTYVVDIEKTATFSVWHCGTVTGMSVAHDSKAEAKTLCGGEAMELKDEVTIGDKLFDKPAADFNEEVAKRLAFFEPGDKADFPAITCGEGQSITKVIAGAVNAILPPLPVGHINIGIAQVQCGHDKALQAPVVFPLPEEDIAKNTFYGEGMSPFIAEFDSPPEEILHCQQDDTLVGWVRTEQKQAVGGGATYRALCRAKK